MYLIYHNLYVFQLPCTHCKTQFIPAEHAPTLIRDSVGGKYKQSVSARLRDITDCGPKMLAYNILPENFAVSLFLLGTKTSVVVSGGGGGGGLATSFPVPWEGHRGIVIA